MRAVFLIAAREFRTRLASKPVLLTTGLIVVAVVVAGYFLAASPAPAAPRVAAEEHLVAPLTVAAAASGVALTVAPADEAAAEAVLAGDLAALVTGPATRPRAVVADALDPGLAAALTVMAREATLGDAVADLGGDRATLEARLAAAGPEVTALTPEAGVDAARTAAGMLSGILIFIAITMAGQFVAQGVVEEKASRVVEILLATVRPGELMAGKVLGIGLVGLAQLAAIGLAGASVLAATGGAAASGVGIAAVVGWVLVWFLLGYALYAGVLAAAGALVSRIEDVQVVTLPVTLLMMVPYVLGLVVAPADPTSPLLARMSLFPAFSPFLMPVRIAQGTAQVWEVATSLALTAAAIPLVVWLAGRVYARAVLHTGGKVRLREVL